MNIVENDVEVKIVRERMAADGNMIEYLQMKVER